MSDISTSKPDFEMPKVDLDALIPREEFTIAGTSKQGDYFDKISAKDFDASFFYPILRKPIFQRETNEWDEKKIGDFIESLLNGDLIPSIILWRSQTGLCFVIDGAHRLSALIAWIKNDYGDGEISHKFYENNIDEEKKIKAEKTRKYVNKRIGSYIDISQALISQENNQEYSYKAKGLIHSLIVQWVKGDAIVAENSFFRINQQGVALNPTEKKLLQSRKKGNCIAARAISKAGSGFKYWLDFSAENQNNIERIAKEINEMLFKPPLKTPVKSLDYLPLAGKNEPSQSLPLILDFVNITNNIASDFNTKAKSMPPDDKIGEYCLSYLREARKTAWRISSQHSSSLGLHPIVYFYTLDGRHKPASFYAAVAWIMEMEKNNSFNDFISVRPAFENILINYDYIIQQINRQYRQVINSYEHIKNFYVECIKHLKNGEETISAITKIIANSKFNYLKVDSKIESVITSKDFSDNRKSSVLISKAIPNALKCEICGGYIDPRSITIDHAERKRDGGLGNKENGLIAHPYCNSTYKN
jgi:Protein of unknown function DUF262